MGNRSLMAVPNHPSLYAFSDEFAESEIIFDAIAASRIASACLTAE
jgi:hypothetical protein